MTFEQIDTIARQVLRFTNHDQYWRFNAIVGHLSPAETEAVRSRARTILKGNIWMLTDEKKGALLEELGHLDEDDFMEVLRDAFAYRATFSTCGMKHDVSRANRERSVRSDGDVSRRDEFLFWLISAISASVRTMPTIRRGAG